MLAGISAEYYTQLERGDIRGVSEEVLAAVVRALRLNEAEQVHLADLMRVLNAARAPDHEAAERDVPMTVRSIVDALSVPALVRNRRLDIVYSNPRPRMHRRLKVMNRRRSRPGIQRRSRGLGDHGRRGSAMARQRPTGGGCAAILRCGRAPTPAICGVDRVVKTGLSVRVFAPTHQEIGRSRSLRL